ADVLIKDFHVIKHTTVGSTVVAECDQRALREKQEISVRHVVLHHGTKNFYRNTAAWARKWWHNSPNYLVTVEFRSAETYTTKLAIINASVSHEGSYKCEVSSYNHRRLLSGEFLRLYVHDTRDKNPCKNNWVYYRPTRTCIRAMLDSMDWADARNFCRYHHDADLIKVTTTEMDNFVSSISGVDYPFWIGLKRESGSQNYYWLDDRSQT
ncbi:hypothetical protein RRG08_059707, partial [Elysia crispata]